LAADAYSHGQTEADRRTRGGRDVRRQRQHDQEGRAGGRLPAVRLRERGWLRFNADEIERLCKPSAGEDAILVEADQLRVEEVLIERGDGRDA
jgi:hypothetical protein